MQSGCSLWICLPTSVPCGSVAASSKVFASRDPTRQGKQDPLPDSNVLGVQGTGRLGALLTSSAAFRLGFKCGTGELGLNVLTTKCLHPQNHLHREATATLPLCHKGTYWQGDMCRKLTCCSGYICPVDRLGDSELQGSKYPCCQPQTLKKP